MDIRKAGKLLLLLVLLALGGFLLANKTLLDDNIYSLRRGTSDVRLPIAALSGDMREKEVRGMLAQVPLQCDPLGPEDKELGDRACSADIRSLNGVGALRLAFFFREGTLAQLKVDIPWWLHRKQARALLKEFGAPTAVQQLPVAGERLVGWEMQRGNLFYNRDADPNPLWWNTVYWMSHVEAKRSGAGFIKADAPAWKERSAVETAMAFVAFAFSFL